MNVNACKRDGFFNVLAAIIREISDSYLVLRILKALPFIYQPGRVARKASDVSAAELIGVIKKHVCCGFCQGYKSLHNTVVYMINKDFYHGSSLRI